MARSLHVSKAHQTLADFFVGRVAIFYQSQICLVIKAHHILANFCRRFLINLTYTHLKSPRKLKRKLQHYHRFPPDKLSETTTHQPIRSVRMSENETCLIFPRQDPVLTWLVGIHPTLADFLSVIKNRPSPDKESASV